MRTIAGVLMVAMVSFCTSAAAQDAKKDAEPPPAAADEARPKRDTHSGTETSADKGGTTPQTIPPVEVGVTRSGLGWIDEPACVTVTTSREPVMWQPFRLSEVVSVTPGVWVSGEGRFGYKQMAYIRGAKPTQSLVLLDDVRLNDPTLGGQFDLADIDPHAIRRVEVLRGAGSALYGSDAIGGVVRIESILGEAPTAGKVTLLGGRYDSALARTALTGQEGGVRFTLAASAAASRNAFDRCLFRRYSLLTHLRFLMPGGRSVQVLGRFAHRRSQFPFDYQWWPAKQLVYDDNITQEHSVGVLAAVFRARPSESTKVFVQPKVVANFSRFLNEGDTVADQVELDSRNTAVGYGVEARVSRRLLRKVSDGAADTLLTLLLGGEAMRYDTEARSDYWDSWAVPPQMVKTKISESFTTFGVYAQLTARHGPLRAVVGLRQEHNSSYGDATSPRLGLLLWLKSERLALRANAGAGFRAPTPAELYDPWVGNDALKAERSVSTDAGFLLRFGGRFRAEVSFFSNRIRNMISYDLTTSRLENLSRAEIEGMEAAVRMKTSRLGRKIEWTISYTHQDPYDPRTDTRLGGLPRDFGSLMVSERPRENMRMGLLLTVSGPIPDEGWLNTRGQRRGTPGKRTALSLVFDWRLTKNMNVIGRLDNVLGDRYVDRQMEPRANGRSLFLGLTCSF